MKIRKKTFVLIMLILICILIFSLVQVYAKYLSSSIGNTKITVASWNIKVNDLSIKTNTDISSAIKPVFPGNEHIASDVITPTSEGYFDLNLDFSDVDVSFEYVINAKVSDTSPVKDLVVTGYSIDDQEKIIFDDFNSPISDIILLNSGITNRKIRIYIMWNDDETTQTMSNLEDTAVTSSNQPITFDVNISFTQKIEI